MNKVQHEILKGITSQTIKELIKGLNKKQKDEIEKEFTDNREKLIKAELDDANKSIERSKRSLATIDNERAMLTEAYGDIFDMILVSEKKSHEHLKLLVIENALNDRSVKICDRDLKAQNNIVINKTKVAAIERG